ncbi:hypothetical protein J5N58_20805 [Rhizobium cremeum]|uniref:hypothetical protein n=1 Tax=Rhizobium cremeum TaxID=2813827 RepID=UPI001FD079F5|nr:hypothetical protein [Rhizobium cremeum]MCJ7996908.1 hypothetical protein [Rhizobium cremeum]MCJ8002126.1 hypothetical protein [Rhizobium cremeum]
MKVTNWAKVFRKEVGSRKNPRSALQEIRAQLGDQSPTPLFGELGHVPLFKSSVAKNGFPTRFAELWSSPRLRSMGIASDILWNIEVCLKFSKELNAFISDEARFNDLYIFGDFPNGLELIDKIQGRLGLSLWLLSRRLTLLSHIDTGRYDDYVSDLIGSGRDGSIVSWLVYMMSYRADKSVTSAQYLSQIDRSLDSNAIRDDLRSFLKYHTLSIPPQTLHECEHIAAASESAPIIDRYMALVDILQSLTVQSRQNPGLRPFILLAVNRLRSLISDYRLELINETLDPNEISNLLSRVDTDAADLYTRGEYDLAAAELSRQISDDPSSCGLYTLLAHATIRSECSPELPVRTADIVRHISAIITFSEDEQTAFASLSREGLSGAHRPLATVVRTLFSDSDSTSIEPDHVFAALNSRTITPRQLRLLPVPDESAVLDAARDRFSDSLAIELQHAISLFGKEELNENLLVRLPPERAALYAARALSRLGRQSEAINILSSLEANELDVVANDALRELFIAFASNNRLKDALRVAARAHRRNERLHPLFKIEPLLQQLSEAGSRPPYEEIALSICHYIHNRFGGGTDVGAQADAAEEYVLSRGMERPSEINLSADDEDASLLPIFLDQVCSPPVLDRFISVDNAAQAELERLEICRILSEIDPRDRQRYLDEIREITRRRVVRERFQQVERTKIYVDTEGIKRQAEKTLRDAYIRLTATLSEGTPSSERVELMRKVQRILSEVNADGIRVMFPDLPANESDLQFHRLVNDVMRLLISSQEYGLEAYLSTRVRHGTMGNQLRSAFEMQTLVTQRDKGRYVPDEFWANRLAIDDHQLASWLANRLAKFSEQIDAAIEDLVRKRVQVRSEQLPEGLFVFQTFEPDSLKIQSEISAETSFDLFMDKVIDQFWDVLEQTLVQVRRFIEGDFQTTVHSLTDELERDLTKQLAEQHVLPIRDAIAAARTQLSVNVASVANWFTLARGTERPDYEFGVAVEVATESIRACHPNLDIELTRTDEVTFECRGRTLESLVYMVFTALDNAIKHCGFSGRRPAISLSTKVDSGWLELRLTNSCMEVVDYEQRNLRLRELRDILETEISARGLATTEGGSGYAKIVRILKHDLLSKYTLSFGYETAASYCVVIGMEAKAIIK